jgi:hypothetical protein
LPPASKSTHEERGRFAFAAGDDLQSAVAVQIHSDSVLDRTSRPDRYARPRLATALRAGMQKEPRDPPLFEAGNDVEAAIGVEVRELDAVGAAGTPVDRVPHPRLGR